VALVRSSPWPQTAPTTADRGSYADAELRPYWQTTIAPRQPHPPLEERGRCCELCIVGGGFTGLWAALYAKELNPARSVVVLEASRCGDGASSRNGGFLQASLTHGLANGISRFPDEVDQLERLGAINFGALAQDLARYGIDAEFENTGALDVALAAHELDELRADASQARDHGHDVQVLDAEQVRAEVNSPLYLGGVWDRTGAALVNPARLVDGLRQAAVAAGVEIHEHSAVQSLGPHAADSQVKRRRTGPMELVSAGGTVIADRILIATSAYPSPLKQTRPYIAPVYDYALMTEPLSPAQLTQIGWENRQGMGDLANQFHYYRLSVDNRILWGGYDAVYRYGGPVGPHLDGHDPTFAKLAQHFFVNFPQLKGVRFTHCWGGAIDTCSRFSVFFGTAHQGRVAYALGYTGLGVGASRFGGRTALDLLDGRDSEATRLDFVTRRPVPFPPEPARSAVIQLTRNRLAAADRKQGQRGLWLRTLDRAGLGFDS
jgi:glycine/D-amino acid oxidase-like deaminating enzyme